MLRSRQTVALAILLASWSCRERSGQQIGVHRDSAHNAASAPLAVHADSNLFPEPSLSPDTGPRYVVHGVCPFECCQYGRWRLESPATLRVAPAQDSDSIGVLETGSHVLADSGVVVMHPVGLQVITRASSAGAQEDSIGFAVGDTVEVLNYEGEGSFRIRWRGRELSGPEVPWDGAATRTVRQPVGSWWVHMTDSTSTRHGWVLMLQRQGIELIQLVESAGSDACG